MNEREQFWEAWFAEREAISAEIDAEVQQILAEGYGLHPDSLRLIP